MTKEGDQGKQKEEEKYEEKFPRRMGEEQEIQAGNQKKSYEMRGKVVREDRYKNVKLRKLIITEFEGTDIDWFPFLNQHEYENDRLELHAMSKFKYLKESLAAKVRFLIDTLPFTSGGDSRAIAILKAKFRKPSEVSAAHIQCITSPSVIANSNPNRIHKFYEKLVISVHAHENMNK